MNELYNNYNEYLAHTLREKIIAKRVINLGVIEILVKRDLITIVGYGIPNTFNVTFTYITNRLDIPITKDTIIRALNLNPNDRFYIVIEEAMLNLDSEITFETIERANQIKELFYEFRREFEEFFDYIDYNLMDYLLEYPEDAE